MGGNFKNLFLILARTIFFEETFFKYSLRIKFRELREKEVFPIDMFFRMILIASISNANQRHIKANKDNILSH